MKFKTLSVLMLILALPLDHIDTCIGKETIPKKRIDDPVYSIDGCNFKIRNLEGGKFDISFGSPAVTGIYKYSNSDEPTDSGLVDYYPRFYCLPDASRDDINNQLSAKKINGHWISLDTNKPFKPTQHIKNYSPTGKNWKGEGFTYDDEFLINKIVRTLNLCLVETGGKQVLCVNAPLVVPNDPSVDLLPRFTRVLQSIEFVN